MDLLNWRWWFGLQPEFCLEPSKEYSISVLIPAHNEEASIATTIESIKKQTVKIDKIIVIDDCSNDKTGEIAKSCGAVVIRTDSKQGNKAMAQNYALPLVDTDLVVTIDGDTLLHEDAVKRTLPYFNDPKAASVCGYVIPQKIETVWERGRFIEYLFSLSIVKSAQNNIGAVIVSSGCFSIFKTEYLKKFKLNNDTMAEDMFLTWQFHTSGLNVYYASDAYCYPLDPPSGNIYFKQANRWYRSFFQNIKKHSLQNNKKFAAFVYGYMLFQIFFLPLETLLLLYFWNSLVWQHLLLFFLFVFLLILIPSVSEGIRLKMLPKVITSIPFYFVVSAVNFYVFWFAFWKEMIVKETLTVWEKGH